MQLTCADSVVIFNDVIPKVYYEEAGTAAEAVCMCWVSVKNICMCKHNKSLRFGFVFLFFFFAADSGCA